MTADSESREWGVDHELKPGERMRPVKATSSLD